MMQPKYSLGLMSGTSFDGIDLALCEFVENEEKWDYKIIEAQTVPYPSDVKEKIQKAGSLNPFEFELLNNMYGRFLGELCKSFVSKNNIKPDLIASHGHTIFHRPELGITFQMGNGAEIAAINEIPVVYDFRIADVALGGHGAPLVPVGDEYLFSGYGCCLNIGGIANLSARINGVRKAWDICPANMALNTVVKKTGKDYDEDGLIARTGTCNPELLTFLNGLDFYNQESPKSLGKEWFDEKFFPHIEDSPLNIPDLMNTLTHHVAERIVFDFHKTGAKDLFITGGGAHNSFLVETIRTLTDKNVHVPDRLTVDFKEALVFAFLGLLRMQNRINCFSSVTGASRDSVCGIVSL